jgi:hypothetical protein
LKEAFNDAAAKTEMYPLNEVDVDEFDAAFPPLPHAARNAAATINNETRLRIRPTLSCAAARSRH